MEKAVKLINFYPITHSLNHTISCYYLLMASGKDTQMHTHTYAQTKAIARNQASTSLWLAHTWFKNFQIQSIDVVSSRHANKL